jgi:hypothetical protein
MVWDEHCKHIHVKQKDAVLIYLYFSHTYLHTYFMNDTLLFRRWDSAVSTVTGYRLDDQEVGVRVLVVKIFSPVSRPALGPTKPPVQRVPGAHSPRVKWPGCEADHSSPTSVEVKMPCIYMFTPPHIFMA